MNVRRRKMIALGVLAGLGFSATGASASLILPGGSTSAASTPFDPSLGTLHISTGAQNFTATFPALFSGTFTQEVRQEGLTANPLGGLTFTYEVSNDLASQTSIKRLIGGSFGSFATDVSTFGPGESALTFDRDASGIVVGANFTVPSNSLDPGESSAVLVIRTDAPAFTNGFISIIDGGSAGANGYAPVPEPGVAALVGIATFALLARRWRGNT